MADTWWEYVKRVSGETQQKVIAVAAGFDPSTVNRWASGTRPRAEHVAVFARTYGRPPVEAFVASGYLKEDEAADVIYVERGLGKLTHEELLAEVLQRMETGDSSATTPPNHSEAAANGESASHSGDDGVPIRELISHIRVLFAELRRRIPEIDDIVDEPQDWPEPFLEGAGDKPPPVRRSQDSDHPNQLRRS